MLLITRPPPAALQNLDFDFEKCCSVSLSRVNVYGCLVCGRYFQGRGPATHAYTHSLEAGHHLFMQLDSGRVYCLPDMYEVIDRSLADIQFVLNPSFTGGSAPSLLPLPSPIVLLCGTTLRVFASTVTRHRIAPPTPMYPLPFSPHPCHNFNATFTRAPASCLEFCIAEEEVARLDASSLWARALDGSEYMPGLVGLNNMKANDYVNVVLQALWRVHPLRDFFLRAANYASAASPVVQRFGELTRKAWNPRAFKGHVSPHEFMQAVMAASKRRFSIDARGDPVEFFSWLANTLHAELTGGRRRRRSVVTDCLQVRLASCVTPLHTRLLKAGYTLSGADLGAKQTFKGGASSIHVYFLYPLSTEGTKT